MELANIERLLQKYLDATTSVAEENELKAYFTRTNVAPHLEEYKELFTYFSISKQEECSKTIQLKPKKQHWKWLSIAASVVLIISIYGGYENNQQRKAAKIYHETQMALNLLAANLNKGNDAILQLQRFEEISNKVYKQSNK